VKSPLRLQHRVGEEALENFAFTLRKDLLHDWIHFGFLT
jgi:hypothetical protein